jgi:hypothetical protein
MRDKYFVIADIAKVHGKLRAAQAQFDHHEKAYIFHEKECRLYVNEIDKLAEELAEIVQKENSAAGTTEYDPLTGE